MPDSLTVLEAGRSKVPQHFRGLGDLRPGSITAVVRRCGKPSCHCAKLNDPGQEPQFRLTRRVNGKTRTETFPNPTALRKAQREVAEFYRFQKLKLSEELVGINAKICELRPVEHSAAVGPVGEKTAAAIHREITREVNQLLAVSLRSAVRMDGRIWRQSRSRCRQLFINREPVL